MNNYILVHGSFGSPFVNFIPYLWGEIEKRNLEVVYSRFSNWGRLSKLYKLV